MQAHSGGDYGRRLLQIAKKGENYSNHCIILQKIVKWFVYTYIAGRKAAFKLCMCRLEGCADMFHSKEVKQQAEQAKTQLREYAKTLSGVEANVIEAQVEVDQLGMSAAKMDRSLTKVVDFAKDTKCLQSSGEKAMEEALEEMHEIFTKADELKSDCDDTASFLRKQKNDLTELQEQSKRYTGLSKTVSETSSHQEKQLRELTDKIKELHTFLGAISTLALQSAIDAGRLGEEGAQYIKSAEDIRSLSSDFAKQVDGIEQQLQTLTDAQQDMEKHLHTFIGLLRDNNVTLGKLAADATKEAEKEKPDAALLTESALWVSKRLEEVSDDFSKSKNNQQRVMEEMESVGSCYMEQQDSADRIGEAIDNIKQMLSQTDYQKDTI